MLYTYKALTKSGEERTGSIDAVNEDIAVGSLQRRGLIVVSVHSGDTGSIFERDIELFSGVSNKEVVMLSRQMATLFDAQVSALRVFRLLGTESENKTLRRALSEVADDIQSGMSISQALNKHPAIFTVFYVNMVRAGEETGKLNETFLFLADYLERSYEVASKIRSAMVYPAFVIFVFIAVMVLMLVLVIPRLSVILLESGQDIPTYTKVIIALSNFLVNYGVFVFVALVLGGGAVWYYNHVGLISLGRFKLKVPVIGKLFKQLYLSRIADNMHTMLASGIPMVRAVEITGDVVGNDEYKKMLDEIGQDVKTGSPLSTAMEKYEAMPHVMTQIVRVGEETGELAGILERLGKFYRREVDTTVDTLVSLIEPVMIVLLGLGVGTVLAAVLVPIYNIAGA